MSRKRDFDQCVDYNILKSASETTPKKPKVPLKLGEKKIKYAPKTGRKKNEIQKNRKI